MQEALVQAQVSGGNGEWQCLGSVGRTITKDDGRFFCYFPRTGVAPEGATRLLIECSGYCQQHVSTYIGNERNVVVMEEAGQLTGRLLLGPGITGSDCVVILRCAYETNNAMVIEVSEDGTFRASDLIPGDYSLTARLRLDNTVDRSEASIEHIRVMSGACVDARLDRISIVGAIVSVQVTVSDKSNLPIFGAFISAAGASPVTTNTEGIAVLKTPALPCQVTAQAIGFASKTCEVASPSCHIVLAVGIPIELELTGGEGYWRDMRVLFCSVPQDGKRVPLFLGIGAIPQALQVGADGCIHTKLPATGQYEAVPLLWVNRNGRRTLTDVPSPVPMRFVVEETQIPQRIQLVISSEAIRELVGDGNPR